MDANCYLLFNTQKSHTTDQLCTTNFALGAESIGKTVPIWAPESESVETLCPSMKQNSFPLRKLCTSCVFLVFIWCVSEASWCYCRMDISGVLNIPFFSCRVMCMKWTSFALLCGSKNLQRENLSRSLSFAFCYHLFQQLLTFTLSFFASESWHSCW